MWMEIKCTEEGSIAIGYDLAWVHALMSVSAKSMVPFSWFSVKAHGLVKGRSYPRSFESGFTLGEFETTDPKGGGRPHSEDYKGPLIDLLATKSEIPLSDVAILSKRELCLFLSGKKLKTLTIEGGKIAEDLTPKFGAYGYPLLCILGQDSDSKAFPSNQAQWRLIQSVFCAELTAEIRAAKIGLEVVAREGFGSLFPTLADLPTGIRLDPGLLPPKEGAVAVLAALKVIDGFILEVRKAKPKWLEAKWLSDLGGYTDSALDAVDRLTSLLHGARSHKVSPDYMAVIDKYSGKGLEDCLDEFEDFGKIGVKYLVDSQGQVSDARKAKKFKRKKLLLSNYKMLKSDEVDMSGYGSESDYEEEEEEEEKETKKSPLYLKKYAVATGMAALRMAVRYGAEYSAVLHTKAKWNGDDEHKRAPGITTWAPYFELDHSDLVKSAKAKINDMSLLVFDGAPNPINIPDKAPSTKGLQWGAIIIDTTNNTSKEKAIYVLSTRALLAQGDPGGLLIMVDSASKHPTGGDLVHGVIRVYGEFKAVASFHQQLTLHLKGGKYKAIKQTLLTEGETSSRRDMIGARLLTRNLDIFRLVSAL